MAVNENPGVYYSGSYWNDLPAVRMYLNKRATGDESTTWIDHAVRLRGKPFEKALFLNCGNGWVERDWLHAGAIKSAVGVDYSEPLLDEARASAVGLPIEYHQIDTNLAVFPGEGYDLIVNHAAGHHVTRVDAVLRSLSQLLSPDGWFVNWDYVGPHRNQYGWPQWAEAHRLNNRAPAPLKQRMRYPDLASMIATDPTEAIHSELFLETLNRYFVPIYDRAVGGWVAYLLLTGNASLLDANPTILDPWVAEVLERDANAAATGNTLFRYVIACPKPAALDDQTQLNAWAEEESNREAGDAASTQYYQQSLKQDLWEMTKNPFDAKMLKPAFYHLVIRRLRNTPAGLRFFDSAIQIISKMRSY